MPDNPTVVTDLSNGNLPFERHAKHDPFGATLTKGGAGHIPTPANMAAIPQAATSNRPPPTELTIMKIVHVDDFAHPDAGYEINLLSRLQAKQGHEVIIVAGELDKLPATLTAFFGRDDIPERDERFRRETGVRILRVPLHAFYSGRAIFHRRIFSLMNELAPDVAFVHGMESVTGIEFTLRSNKLPYPIVLDSHNLEMASIHPLKNIFRTFYKSFIAPLILRRGISVIRIVDSDYVQKCLGIPLTSTTLLSFGTDTDHFQPDMQARARFRRENGISDDAFVILYAGKLDATKGGELLAEALRERFSAAADKEIVFLIVGNTDGSYGEKIEAVFQASQNRILRFPTQRYFNLAAFYQAADLALFPRQCSVSFFEAQSCGLPVIFEVNEINRARMPRGNAMTFEPGSITDFRAKIAFCIDMPAAQFQHVREQARQYVVENYNYVPIAEQFTAVMARAAAQFKASQRPAA